MMTGAINSLRLCRTVATEDVARTDTYTYVYTCMKQLYVSL